MGLYGPPPLDQLVDAMGAFCPVRALGCQTYCFKRDGSLGRATTSSGGFGPVDFRRDPSGAESANAGVAFQPPTPAGGSGSGPGGAKEVYRDDFVTISSVVLAPGNEVLASMGENSAEARAGEDDFLESNPKRFRLDGRGSASPSPSPRTPPPESTTPRGGDDAKLSVVYICELPDVPGKFDPGKARARGLPPGKDYARLVQGETVTAPNGQVIKPSDVMGPTTPGPVFVLADCPTPAHLGALVGAQGLARFQAGAERGKQVGSGIGSFPTFEMICYDPWTVREKPVFVSCCKESAAVYCFASSLWHPFLF